jgi:hypothetical protein
MHERRTSEAPRARRRFERIGIVAKEAPLLFRCQHERAPLRIVLDRAEDAAVRAEIGMPHVRALENALECEGETAKIPYRRHRTNWDSVIEATSECSVPPWLRRFMNRIAAAYCKMRREL